MAAEEAAELNGAPNGVGFRWYQLITCAFLHDATSIRRFMLHLGGNMLFLLVFGLRVNELVGTLRMIILYLLLAAGSSYVDGLSHLHDPLTPSVGATGAIMGLAGIYLVFFPIQRVRMAFCVRQRWYRLFTMRGFWLPVLWIGFNDVLPILFRSEDEIGHWAHLGGFLLGVLCALALLLTRQVSAGGRDLLSVVLGKRAWALLGKPASAPLLPV
jgi:membrane associated rhomboid family serine protease